MGVASKVESIGEVSSSQLLVSNMHEGEWFYIGTNCPQVTMLTETGKNRKTLAGNTQDIFRLIQSVPSKKAEPFKRWLAKVGYERIQEIENPELAQDRMKLLYEQKGYPKEAERLQAMPEKRLKKNWGKYHFRAELFNGSTWH